MKRNILNVIALVISCICFCFSGNAHARETPHLEEFHTNMYAHSLGISLRLEKYNGENEWLTDICSIDLNGLSRSTWLIISPKVKTVTTHHSASNTASAGYIPAHNTYTYYVKALSTRGGCKGKTGYVGLKWIGPADAARYYDPYNKHFYTKETFIASYMEAFNETIKSLESKNNVRKLLKLQYYLDDTTLNKKISLTIAQLSAPITSELNRTLACGTGSCLKSFYAKWKAGEDNYQVVIDAVKIKPFVSEMFTLASKSDGIKDYSQFIRDFPQADQTKEAIEQIFIQVKEKKNIAGYEWFIETYPKAPQGKEAIEKIHALAFEEAEDIDRISSYNTFIIAYPSAAEVKEANEFARGLEYYKYNDTLPSWFRSIMPDFLASFFNGIFGVFSSDEKKSRALLIKAKQIERDGNDYYGSKKDGYVIIANRMYGLLQEEYDDTDATLRYLESEEFKDFVQTFKRVMRSISSKLDNIAHYSSEILEVSKKGFSDEKADQAMSEYYTKQHRDWEKQMHLQDKGYR